MSTGLHNPHLSVVVPTYNRVESLRRTLDGLASQDYPHDAFEVVVVSDGSTDGTHDFVRTYAAAAPYCLRLIEQQNAGPARARNRGIAEARGEIVLFLDDDVEPMPGLVRAHIPHHAASCRIAVIGPMSPDPKCKRAEPVWIAWEHMLLARQYRNWNTGVWKGAGARHFYTGNASVRREHLQAVGGFDETFKRQEDVELAYRLERERGISFVFEPAAIGLHRPSRSLSAWLKAPFMYGQLDMVRAQRGDVSWETISSEYRNRRWATRVLARAALSCPMLVRPLRAALLGSALLCYRLGLQEAAFGAMSVVYNLRYVEGMRAEIGSAPELRRLMAFQ